MSIARCQSIRMTNKRSRLPPAETTLDGRSQCFYVAHLACRHQRPQSRVYNKRAIWFALSERIRRRARIGSDLFALMWQACFPSPRIRWVTAARSMQPSPRPLPTLPAVGLPLVTSFFSDKCRKRSRYFSDLVARVCNHKRSVRIRAIVSTTFERHRRHWA